MNIATEFICHIDHGWSMSIVRSRVKVHRMDERLQRGEKSLFSGHENRASPCQWLFRLVNSRYSFKRSIFYAVWEIQKIYVCPSWVKVYKFVQHYGYVIALNI